MNIPRLTLRAKKACIRCSAQKRRCDKGLPECELCLRLGQTCKYNDLGAQTIATTSTPTHKTFPPTSHLKDVIMQRLDRLTVEDALLAYCRAIEPWFPLISISRLHDRVATTWDEVSSDHALLYLSIVLFTSFPASTSDNSGIPSELLSLYCHTKSCIALSEALGMNSIQTVQARVLVTFYELAHGLYPAAYISIGSAICAADALVVHPKSCNSNVDKTDDEMKQEDNVLLWCGILILDMYIAAESGTYHSITQPRSQTFQDMLKPHLCPTHASNQDRTDAVCRMARLVEASYLLDRIHTALISPTTEQAFDTQEVILTVQALFNLQMIMYEEIGEGIHLYAGGLSLCNSALLLAVQNGSEKPTNGGVTEKCQALATECLASLLSTIVGAVEPFTVETRCLNFDILPPFVAFQAYKAAAIITKKLLVGGDTTEGLKQLRILRRFLRKVGERCLSCGRYLKLLDEDTTPRIARALEHG